MRPAQYEEWRQTFALLARLARSKDQHRAGKHKSSEEVFSQLESLIAQSKSTKAHKKPG
jgi:hypothetical protein